MRTLSVLVFFTTLYAYLCDSNSTNTTNTTDKNDTKKNDTTPNPSSKKPKRNPGEKTNSKYFAVDASLGGEESKPIQSVKDIKTTCFVNLAYIIGFLNPEEQMLCVEAFKANNDTERCLDFKTVNTKLKGIKAKIANQTSKALSDRSLEMRKSMGCLLRASLEVSKDDMTVNNALSVISREQGLANRATAFFTQEVTNLISLRWKFFTYKIADQKTLGVVDASGIFEGFVFSGTELNAVIDAFRDYAYEQYEFRVVFLDTMTKSMRAASTLFKKFNGCGKVANDTKGNETVPRPNCTNGTHWSPQNNSCIKDSEDNHTCVNGTVWHEKLHKCVANCTNGTYWSDVNNTCLNKTVCALRQHWIEENNTCVNDNCTEGNHWSKVNRTCVANNCTGQTHWSEEEGVCKDNNCTLGVNHWSKVNNSCIDNNCTNTTHWSDVNNTCIDNGCNSTSTWSYKDNGCVNATVKPASLRYLTPAEDKTNNCTAGAHWNGTNCTNCTSGTWDGFACTNCTNNTHWNGTNCTNCPSGTNWNGANCTNCSNVTHWDNQTLKCVANNCTNTTHWDNQQYKCVDNNCTNTTHWEYLAGACVNNTIMPNGTDGPVVIDYTTYLSETSIATCHKLLEGELAWTKEKVDTLLSTHRPAGDLHKDLLEEFKEEEEIFKYIQHSKQCDLDVMYTIKDGKMKCTGNCYKGVNDTNITNMDGAKLPSSYEIAFGCKKANMPWTFARMTDKDFGNRISFTYLTSDFGHDMRIHQQKCAFAVINPKATEETKKECRMEMTTGCRRKLEDSCIKSGLSDLIVANKITKAIPKACDNFDATYNKVKCLNWINARLLRNSFQLRISQYEQLADYIADEEPKETPKRRFFRYLPDDVTPTTDEIPPAVAVATEVQEKLIFAQAKLDDVKVAFTIEGSTADKVVFTDLTTIDAAAKEQNDPVVPVPSSGSKLVISLLCFLLALIFI